MVLLMFNQRTVGLYHFRLMQTITGVQEKVEASTDRHPFFVPFFLQYLLGI